MPARMDGHSRQPIQQNCGIVSPCDSCHCYHLGKLAGAWARVSMTERRFALVQLDGGGGAFGSSLRCTSSPRF